MPASTLVVLIFLICLKNRKIPVFQHYQNLIRGNKLHFKLVASLSFFFKFNLYFQNPKIKRKLWEISLQALTASLICSFKKTIHNKNYMVEFSLPKPSKRPVFKKTSRKKRKEKNIII